MLELALVCGRGFEDVVHLQTGKLPYAAEAAFKIVRFYPGGMVDMLLSLSHKTYLNKNADVGLKMSYIFKRVNYLIAAAAAL